MSKEIPTFAKVLLTTVAAVELGSCAIVPPERQVPSPTPEIQPGVSENKLGFFVLHATPEAEKLARTKTKVFKVLDAQGDPKKQRLIRIYNEANPSGEVDIRVYCSPEFRKYTVKHDPLKSADDYWKSVLQPAIQKMSVQERENIDGLYGTNEADNVPRGDEPGGCSLAGYVSYRSCNLNRRKRSYETCYKSILHCSRRYALLKSVV